MTEIKVGVLGASGLAGGELLRLLASHPRVEVTLATSREFAGRPIHAAHPHLRGFYAGLKFSRLDGSRILDVDLLFNAMPHGVGASIVGEAVDSGVRVIDMSADYRFRDPEVYRLLYKIDHPRPDLLAEARLSIPELVGDRIRGARIVSIPGCNSTASILALAPLVRDRLIEDRVVIDVKASSSEAGGKPSKWSHHPIREGSLRPYSPSGHRHSWEVRAFLEEVLGWSPRVTMIPHAVPMVRGVLASAHAWLREGFSFEDVARAYLSLYRGRVFIRLKPLKPGVAAEPPDVKNIVGSEFAEIGFSLEEGVGRVSGFTAIDNLVRGAAGQAVHSMNLVLGWPETEGLLVPPIRP